MRRVFEPVEILRKSFHIISFAHLLTVCKTLRKPVLFMPILLARINERHNVFYGHLGFEHMGRANQQPAAFADKIEF